MAWVTVGIFYTIYNTQSSSLPDLKEWPTVVIRPMEIDGAQLHYSPVAQMRCRRLQRHVSTVIGDQPLGVLQRGRLQA